MHPGQATLQLSALAAPLRSGGYEAFSTAQLSAPWSETTGARLVLGAQLTDGGLRSRDGSLEVTHLLANRPARLVRVSGGVSLPLGSVGTALGVAPGSSRSVDPRLGVDAVIGGTWLGVLGLSGRTPLYAGPDDIRQGAFGRLDLRGARRVSDRAVPWAGLSVSASAPDSAGNNDFVELAATAGAVVNLAERWALSAQLRIPVAGAPWPIAYPLAGGVSVSRVMGGGDSDSGARAR